MPKKQQGKAPQQPDRTSVLVHRIVKSANWLLVQRSLELSNGAEPKVVTQRE